jgi:hypothetical protein
MMPAISLLPFRIRDQLRNLPYLQTEIDFAIWLAKLKAAMESGDIPRQAVATTRRSRSARR